MEPVYSSQAESNTQSKRTIDQFLQSLAKTASSRLDGVERAGTTPPASAYPTEQQNADNVIVGAACVGKRGPDQERIGRQGMAWLALLLRKNADYGSSAWKKPVLAPECDADAAMRVRMSDKIERVRSLLDKGQKPEVEDESLRDTIRDLGAYCLLWLARPEVEASRQCQ